MTQCHTTVSMTRLIFPFCFFPFFFSFFLLNFIFIFLWEVAKAEGSHEGMGNEQDGDV